MTSPPSRTQPAPPPPPLRPPGPLHPFTAFPLFPPGPGHHPGISDYRHPEECSPASASPFLPKPGSPPPAMFPPVDQRQPPPPGVSSRSAPTSGPRTTPRSSRERPPRSPRESGPPPTTASRPPAGATIHPFPPTRVPTGLPQGPPLRSSHFARGQFSALVSDRQRSSGVRGSNVSFDGRHPTLHPLPPGGPPRRDRGFAPLQPPQGPGQSCPVRSIRLPMTSPTTSPRPVTPTHRLAPFRPSPHPHLFSLSPGAARVSTASDPQGSVSPPSRPPSLPAAPSPPRDIQP